MTAIAPTLEAFFTDRLMNQQRVSPRTVAAYRDCFRLLLVHLRAQTGKEPSELDFEDLDARAVTGFLAHLERGRSNSVRTRNNRLAALRSFFRFAAFRHPEHAWLIQQVLAIPQQRPPRGVVAFLSEPELQALLASPDCSTRIGRRDRTLLVLAVQTGLRVSELTALRCADVQLGPGAHVRATGKGRKQRCTPLPPMAVRALASWTKERRGHPDDPLFPGRHNAALSSDAVQRMIAKHAATAALRCPTLRHKRVTPHVLRHTTAMTLLAAGVDQSVIALWLGHERVETTDMYVHGDLAIKERAIARTAPLNAGSRRYRPPDRLLAFLESL